MLDNFELREARTLYVLTEATCGYSECVCEGRLHRGIFNSLEQAQGAVEPKRERRWKEVIPSQFWRWQRFDIRVWYV
jgi:hypothetical protein